MILLLWVTACLVCSHHVREGIVNGLEKANKDDNVRAIVLTGSDRKFISGADIREFTSGQYAAGTSTVLMSLCP